MYSTMKSSSSSTAARLIGRSIIVLVRIIPPARLELDPKRRPFVVVDPRAGHGPGIGGFKADSEIGVAFKAGHPCYFVGFLPDPCRDRPSRTSLAPKRYSLKKSLRSHPRGRRQTLRDRQLSGRLGDHDAGGHSPGTVRPDHHCRIAAIVLGGRARQVSRCATAAACSAAAG